MRALIFNEEQSERLRAANAGSLARKLEPCRLADGRLFLNADALEDDLFGSAEGPWRAVLMEAAPVDLTDEALA